LLEFSDSENCFVLQDLNSREGTFVNDCRVQNAAVRLAAGDVVRFGYSGIPYELLIEQTEQVRPYPKTKSKMTNCSCGLKDKKV
jgi:pSer/pThr/pTyr-binding forkhead associated (FHA) protein